VQIAHAGEQFIHEAPEFGAETERLVGGRADEFHQPAFDEVAFGLAGIDAAHGIAARLEQPGLGEGGKDAATEIQHGVARQKALQPEIAVRFEARA
jgi:hypothetical protein